MKQYLFLATAIATASLFTGCSNNEYVGDQPEALNGTDGAIVFSMGKANTTRAGEFDNEAANKLNGVFYVYGTKTLSGQSEPVVFNNYKVSYSDGTKSPSNTKGWEYVGESYQHNEGANVLPNYTEGQTEPPSQSIKYWDYSASSYNFYAFSAKPADISNNYIQVKKITSGENEYEVTVKPDASVSDLYFAEKKVIAKSTNSDATQSDRYGGFVSLTFRNVGSKIRMGFYETIPGYDVNIKKLTIACPNSTPKSDGTSTSKVTVKYDSDTEGNTLNQPQITTVDFDSQSSLNLGDNATTATKIGENSTNLTWTKSGGIYTPVWPQSELTSDICKVTVDYTLTSTDGSGEEIKVTGATATVPTDYINWKANTAYTYIFKISDNTNGTTGVGDDPKGLYPITFDAVVEDMAENTYLTTVSTLSVTASQDGTNFEAPGAGFVFKTNSGITLKVMMHEGTDVTDVTDDTERIQITGDYITGYDYKKTPEQNLEDAGKDFRESVGTSLVQQTNPGYWVLKVVVDGTKTTYVIIRVGNAEDPANP